eukprot:334518-Amphidinium_carterae.1
MEFVKAPCQQRIVLGQAGIPLEHLDIGLQKGILITCVQKSNRCCLGPLGEPRQRNEAVLQRATPPDCANQTPPPARGLKRQEVSPK